MDKTAIKKKINCLNGNFNIKDPYVKMGKGKKFFLKPAIEKNSEKIVNKFTHALGKETRVFNNGT